ncbi:MAG: 16S rRNA (adenine(1518)-N(6)/adenine(1519)-N(6))-dimethyltransferase, partial [Nitrospirota bacterium]|nr:16S rRNA (adenine(1518)-N(6)/adenine(1519)-N(6))-dimethyltransferase [Nitrospirota bacterium]
ADIKEVMLFAGIDPQRRPETLSIEEFARLSDALTK